MAEAKTKTRARAKAENTPEPAKTHPGPFIIGQKVLVISKRRYNELKNDEGDIPGTDKWNGFRGYQSEWCGKELRVVNVPPSPESTKYQLRTIKAPWDRMDIGEQFLSSEIKPNVPQKITDAIEAFLAQFKKLFISSGGPGGGSGEMIDLSPKLVRPCILDTGDYGVAIRHVHMTFRLMSLNKLEHFSRSRKWERTWRATEHTTIREESQIFREGDKLPQAYKWTY